MPTCRALIVDDEPDMLALIALEIEAAGNGLIVAATATSGEEALEVFAASEPHVILLDYMMPDYNGLEVAEKILGRDPSQNIVLFSAFITERTIAEAQRLGIRECVRKDRIEHVPAILRKYGPSDETAGQVLPLR